MTRPDAARKLLALGALSSRQFTEITGWAPKQARNVLFELVRAKTVLRLGGGKHYRYRLAA